MKRYAIAFGAAALLATTAVAQDQTSGAGAVARMITDEGKEAGTVTFRQTKSGLLHVFVELTGLPPGAHGFHVHEKGQCDGDFESAGGHYKGKTGTHGVETEGGPHAGDFPNVHVGQDGLLKVEFFTDRLSLSADAETPLIDEDGSAVVLHADPDDYESDPSGHSGHRLACGVIEQPA